MTLILALFACEHGLTLPPSDGGGNTGPIVVGQKSALRKRVPITPWGIEVPEPALSVDNCGDVPDGGPITGPDCASGTITCGDTIIGHTIGGVQNYNTRFYEKNFCIPALTDHNGGDERVYKMEFPPGDWRAFVYLDTPCGDLDLAAAKLSSDRCPTDGSVIPVCEMSAETGSTRDMVELVSQSESTWWLVVEGKDDHEGPFALHVMCREGLQ